MHKIPLIIFVLLPLLAYCQFGKGRLQLKPIIGFRIHNDAGEKFSRGGRPKILTTPVLGIEVAYKSFPISLGYQRDFNALIYPYFDEFDEIFSIASTWEEDQLQLYWKFKHFSLGAGHYWKKQENFGYHFFGTEPPIKKGVQLSFVYPTKWVDIELRSKIQYNPGFAPIGSGLYSLIFLYRIGNRPDGIDETPKFMTVNGILGARFFNPEIKLLSPGEKFNKPFGIAPGLGLEFLFNKINVSINLEKDWWLYLNGGSPYREIRGLINNTFISTKYHLKLNNQRHIRFGIGGSWIEDNDNKRKNNTEYLNGSLTETELEKLLNFQVKGLGVSLSYEILPNTDVELKTTIPLIGEKAFESTSRTSLGIFYRFNPLRGK